MALKKAVCVYDIKTPCEKCLLRYKCAYPYIFETFPHKNTKYLKNLQDIPRPFIIDPPAPEVRRIGAGETFEVGLTLFGKANNYFPYIIIAFEKLGLSGIGRQEHKFKLDKVYNSKGQEIYDSSTRTLDIKKTRVRFKEIILPGGDSKATIKFITPAIIKYNDRITIDVEFHIIVRALLRRLSALSYFHCKKGLPLNFKEIIEKAKEIRTVESDLKMVSLSRYSTKQQKKIIYNGVMGTVTYEGDIRVFHKLLYIGQFSHIGKNVTFGFGKYELAVL